MQRPTDSLEPAIPAHLRVERTRPLRAPANFVPQHASYSARFLPSVTRLPMVYLGVQSRQSANAASAMANLKAGLEAPDGPAFFDEARFVDDMGHANAVFVGYWDDRGIFDRWNASLPPNWWCASLASNGEVGAFREAYVPAVIDTETTFSHPCSEGYSRIADRMSGKTDTHEYWGSARDRIPRSQTDPLQPHGAPKPAFTMSSGGTSGRLIEIVPHENLCVLRSGQDWSETVGDERSFYLKKVRPLLEKGMQEISLKGKALGCYFNRYMTLQGDDGPLEKTYSVSAWHSLGQLEAWVKADTHLAIWAAGIKHFKLAGEEATLRLYHELMVLRAEDQSFAYFNCHAGTGMLRSIRPRQRK